MTQRRAWKLWVKSARYWTNRMMAENSELSVTPASSSTLVESPWRRIVASP